MSVSFGSGAPGEEPDATAVLAQLQVINKQSAFNDWIGFEIVSARDGIAELALTARPEVRQHTGSLHAGVTGAIIDTACGYAAVTLVGAVVASQYQVVFYAPTTGERFIARARVAKAGKRQIFVNAELFERTGNSERLVAGGNAVLIRVAQ